MMQWMWRATPPLWPPLHWLVSKELLHRCIALLDFISSLLMHACMLSVDCLLTLDATQHLCITDFFPPFSAPLVDQYLNANGIILGKTNLGELQSGYATNPTSNGITTALNPYDPTRTASGTAGFWGTQAWSVFTRNDIGALLAPCLTGLQCVMST